MRMQIILYSTLKQTGHPNGFSPVWIRSWLIKLYLRLKDLMHQKELMGLQNISQRPSAQFIMMGI